MAEPARIRLPPITATSLPAAPRRAPAHRPATADKMLCERCGAEMYRMHAVWRCPAAASRPTAAAGKADAAEAAHGRPRVAHPHRRAEFAANRDRMAALVADLRERLGPRARRAAAPKYLERHREQGKLPVRERIDRLLDPGSPFLELSPLAAWDMYDDEAPARRHRHRHRPRVGPRGADRRQRRHGQGRHLLPDHGEEAPARAGGRAREPPAVRLPRRLGRRVPAAAGRGLPRPRSLRPHLLQPGADVGRAASRRSPS